MKHKVANLLSQINANFLRNFLLPIGDKVFGQQMMLRLKFLEKAQWWEIDRICSVQNQELEKLIQIAYATVPFYHTLLDGAKVLPNEIRGFEDLSRLPIVTKNMLRKGYPDQTTRPTSQKTYEVSTSGSTGENFIVLEDSLTAGWYRASFLLALEWSGWLIGEPHLQTGMTLQRSLDRRIKDWILRCHYVSAYQLDDLHLENLLATIEDFKLNYIWGYPGSLYHLAKYAKKRGWNQCLKSTVTWGDMLLPHYRKEIEDVFNTKVYDTYGCAEGIQISAQCEYGNYHIHALDAAVEFLDDNGNPVKSGETGNVVVTRLHPGPMPLIRYSIGDRGSPAINNKCPCGRNFPIMKSIEGRSADVVITPSGNRLIVHFFTGVLEHFPEITSFQVTQLALDSILIKIVPTGKIDSEKTKSIIQALKQKGCSDLNIDIQVVEKIPLTPAGKNRFVISKLSQ